MPGFFCRAVKEDFTDCRPIFLFGAERCYDLRGEMGVMTEYVMTLLFEEKVVVEV